MNHAPIIPPPARKSPDARLPPMQDSSHTDRRVQCVLGLIATRFPEPWSLATFARHVNLSPPHFVRLFNRHNWHHAKGCTERHALRKGR